MFFMYKNILAPINLESSSKVELLEALKLAQKFNSKVFLLSVHEQFKSKEEMEIMREKKNTTIVDRLPYNKYRYSLKFTIFSNLEKQLFISDVSD